MARLNKMSESPAPGFEDDIYGASPGPSTVGSRRVLQPALSPSPNGSTSSDKENQTARSSTDKGKGKLPMGPPRIPSPAGKRKRAATTQSEREPTVDRTRRRRTVEAEEDDSDSDFYDPDHDIEERRRIRKGLRDIHKNLTENKHAFIHEFQSNGIKQALLEANGYADQVKQTADATVDARFLSSAADYTLKRTIALSSGDTAQGIDVDDFITKCMGFMSNEVVAAEDNEATPSMTQRRQGRSQVEDDGEERNWAHLGRFACLKHNSRPSVPGFLLGPLSVEKKAKKIVVRRAALKHSELKETRPEVLQKGDIEKKDASLTTLCKQIQLRLGKVKRDAVQRVQDLHTDDLSDEQAADLMDQHGVAQNGGVAYFKFVVNPYSFGQTVENMFYVSFLIKEGKVGLCYDERDLPYLIETLPMKKGEGSGDPPAKNQGVVAIDMASWKKLIKVFNIREPMITHREEETPQHGGQGWFH